jgi:hypothetical protein
MKHLRLAMLLASALVPGTLRAADEPAKPTSHTEHKLEGWTVRVDDRLLKKPNDELGRRALRFLENKLADIRAVVPEDRVKQLQQVPVARQAHLDAVSPQRRLAEGQRLYHRP